MKIAIITAMPEEFRAVAAGLGDLAESQRGIFRIGQRRTANVEFMLIQAGMGFSNAASATEMLIEEFHPDLLISTGFCGGISTELLAGDVVVAEHVFIADACGCEEIPVQLSGIGQTFVSRQHVEGKRVAGGTFISTSALTSKAHLAEILSPQPPNMVVDMESGAIAIIAAEHTIPLLVIRAVSDTADEELGFPLEEFCDTDMRRIHPGKVLHTVLRKPRLIPQLVRLAFSSRTAAENITATFSRLLPALENASRS